MIHKHTFVDGTRCDGQLVDYDGPTQIATAQFGPGRNRLELILICESCKLAGIPIDRSDDASQGSD